MATARRLSLFQVVLLGVVCVATLALLLLLARNTHGPAISPQRDDHGEKMEQLEGRLEEMVQLLHHLHNSSHEAAAAAEKPRRAAPTSAPAAREHHQAGGSGGGALAQLKTKLPFISYSAICLVAHNEGGRRLREFATYHLWIGFGKVYLFDHNSTRAAKREQMELLSPLIEAGKVEYYVFAGALPHGQGGMGGSGGGVWVGGGGWGGEKRGRAILELGTWCWIMRACGA